MDLHKKVSSTMLIKPGQLAGRSEADQRSDENNNADTNKGYNFPDIIQFAL